MDQQTILFALAAVLLAGQAAVCLVTPLSHKWAKLLSFAAFMGWFTLHRTSPLAALASTAIGLALALWVAVVEWRGGSVWR